MNIVDNSAILEKIKDGSIVNEIKNYSELNLKESEQIVLDKIINFNKNSPSILPTIKQISITTGFSKPFSSSLTKKLSNKGIIYGFTFPQIFNVFGYYEKCKPKIHVSLYNATSYEMEKLKGYGFEKKMKRSPLATYFKRFHIATVKKDMDGEKVPVFASVFNFLQPYKDIVDALDNHKL